MWIPNSCLHPAWCSACLLYRLRISTGTEWLQEGGGESHEDGAGDMRVGWAALESSFLSACSGFEIYWFRGALVVWLIEV